MNCLICGSGKVKVVPKLPKAKHPNLLHCASCTALWHFPSPTKEELAAWYSKQAMGKRWKGNLCNAVRVNFEQNKGNFEFNFCMLQERLTKESRVLDVGCYNGAFLDMFYKAGCTCTGIDLNDGLLELGRTSFPGLDLRYGRIEDFAFEHKFDVITAHQVLEHIINPIDFLNNLRKNLTPRGVIQMSVPDVDINKKINYPEHLWHFTEKSLRVLLHKVGLMGTVLKRTTEAALVCVVRSG